MGDYNFEVTRGRGSGDGPRDELSDALADLLIPGALSRKLYSSSLPRRGRLDVSPELMALVGLGVPLVSYSVLAGGLYMLAENCHLL